MKKYVNVYPFQVIEKLKEGKEVFCIDRGIHEVHIVKTLPVQTLITILNACDKEENYDRYEFYYIEKKTDTSLEKAIEEVKRFEEGEEK